MSDSVKRILLITTGLLIIIQFIPLDRSNPPVTAEIQLDEDLSPILKRSCYDCHSNMTKWPWYAHVAPVSFFIVHDVHEGREHLNFSGWQNYSAEKKKKLVGEMLDEIREGDMPLFTYTIIHQGTKLSDAEVKSIQAWALSEFGVTGK
jgi:hypothetical protein